MLPVYALHSIKRCIYKFVKCFISNISAKIATIYNTDHTAKPCHILCKQYAPTLREHNIIIKWPDMLICKKILTIRNKPVTTRLNRISSTLLHFCLCNLG